MFSPPKLTINLSPLTNSSLHTISIRKSAQCSISVAAFINSTTTDLFEKQILMDSNAPTRPESDYFIFNMKSQLLPNFLKSSIASKIKYKLIISSSFKSLNPVAYSPCFYCNNGHLFVSCIKLDTTLPLKALFPDWTKNGHGHSLRISSPTKYPSLIEIEQVSKNIWKCKRGSNKYVLEALFQHFNFTMHIFPADGGDSGKLLSGGKWTGAVGDILNSKADLGLSTSYNKFRYQVIGFSRGFQYSSGTFSLGKPRATYSWRALYCPFALNLWLAVGVSLVIVLLAFQIIQRNELCSKDRQLSTLYVAFILVGKDISYPNANPTRVLLLAWMLECMVITTVYVSKIVGQLAFPILELQPKNFKQLADPKFGYAWGIAGGGNLYAHFETSTNPVLRKIFNGFGNQMDPISCLKQAMLTKFACITWSITKDYISHKNFTLMHGKGQFVTADEATTLFVPVGLATLRSQYFFLISIELYSY